MSVDKGRLLTAINERFKGKSLSKTYKEKMAEIWAPTIDNDTDIDPFLESMEPLVLASEAEANSRVSQAEKKFKKDQDPDKKTDPAQKVEDIDPNDPQAALKQLIEINKGLVQTVANLQKNTMQNTLEQRFLADERIKKVPALFLKNRTPQNEEDFESTIEEIVNDYNAFATENKLALVGADTPPAGGGDTPKEGEISPELKKYVEATSK